MKTYHHFKVLEKWSNIDVDDTNKPLVEDGEGWKTAGLDVIELPG